MKKVVFLVAAALTVSMLGGCAGGKTPLDYEVGTYIAPEKVQQLKASEATQKQVVNALGYPTSKSEVVGKEIWKYDYSLIAALPFAKNKNESAVFEWNRAGKLVDAYKTNGGAGSAGNPLLKAAGM